MSRIYHAISRHLPFIIILYIMSLRSHDTPYKDDDDIAIMRAFIDAATLCAAILMIIIIHATMLAYIRAEMMRATLRARRHRRERDVER